MAIVPAKTINSYRVDEGLKPMLKLISQTWRASEAVSKFRLCALKPTHTSLVSQFVCGVLGVRGQHSMATPKLIVFDLDYTLWPFWVDTHVSPPFRKEADGNVHDARNHRVKYYPDVPDIVAKLHSQGYKLGIASRTGAIKDAEDLIRLFNWDQYFHYREIFPDCKITHFKGLHKSSGIPYKDMLFFDDEDRNIRDVSTLGVTCMFVPDYGVTDESMKEGLKLFATNNSKTGPSSS